jgi:phosphonate transport system substrate-binding protein
MQVCAKMPIGYKRFFLLISPKNNMLGRVQILFTNVLVLCVSILFVYMLSGCNQKSQNIGPKYSDAKIPNTMQVYHFAIYPLHNPAKLIHDYTPLMDYLNQRINGVRFSIEASTDYADFEQKYKQRKPEFLLPNPWQTLQAIKVGYKVIATVGDPKDFKGIILVRKDGGIVKPADLKGKAVSYPAPTAFAACIMPQYFLYKHGINVNKDIRNMYVGSQESSILNVYLKKTAAGAAWTTPWRAFQKEYPKEASELMVIWETESQTNNSVMVRNDIPEEIRNQVQQCLVELYKSKQGKAILASMQTTRIFSASNKDYRSVQDFVTQFEKSVRKVSEK